MRLQKNFIARFQTLLAQSALSAALGSAIGFAYARFNLPPELLATNQIIAGGYALAGAAAGVGTLRLGLLARTMLEDYRQGS